MATLMEEIAEILANLDHDDDDGKTEATAENYGKKMDEIRRYLQIAEDNKRGVYFAVDQGDGVRIVTNRHPDEVRSMLRTLVNVRKNFDIRYSWKDLALASTDVGASDESDDPEDNE